MSFRGKCDYHAVESYQKSECFLAVAMLTCGCVRMTKECFGSGICMYMYINCCRDIDH